MNIEKLLKRVVKKSMFLLSNRTIRLLFFVGISFYSSLITYLYVAKYYFYTSLIYGLFFDTWYHQFMLFVWNRIINALLCGYYVSILNFVMVLGFLVHCHCMNFIDNWCKIYIPLLNQSFITIQYINNEYLFTFDESYSWKSIYQKYIEK